MSNAAELKFHTKDATKNLDEAQKGRAKRIDVSHPLLPSGAVLKISPQKILKNANVFGAKKLNTLDKPLEKIEEASEDDWKKSRLEVEVSVLTEKHQNITECPTHGNDSAPGAITILTPYGNPLVKFKDNIFLLVVFNECTPFSHQSEDLTIQLTFKSSSLKNPVVGSIQYHMKKNKAVANKKQKKEPSTPGSPITSPSQPSLSSEPEPPIIDDQFFANLYSDDLNNIMDPMWPPENLFTDRDLYDLLKSNVPERVEPEKAVEQPPTKQADANYEVAAPEPKQIPQWLRAQYWFYKDLTAEQATNILQQLLPGTYLARNSAVPGAFTISLKKQDGTVVHWRFTMDGTRIIGPDNKTHYDSVRSILETFHDSLSIPISYYTEKLVSNNNNNN